jgi:hypothetical protein
LADWNRILRDGVYERRYSIAIPIEGGRVQGRFQVAAEHYRRAIELSLQGLPVQAVAECRKVLESIRDTLKLSPKNIQEWDITNKAQWPFADRIEFARAAIMQMGHQTAHSGTNDDPTSEQATLALNLTGALLTYYSS